MENKYITNTLQNTSTISLLKPHFSNINPDSMAMVMVRVRRVRGNEENELENKNGR